MIYQIKCKKCVKIFESNIDNSHRKYCDDCRFVSCLVCKIRFLIKPGAKKGIQKFCSRKCANKNFPFQLTEKGRQSMIEKIRLIHTGRKNSLATRKKMSDSARGKKNHNYINGSSKCREKLYESIFYKDWRRSVFERDNYTCQECFKRGGFLQAHHIKRWSLFPNLRFDINNGKTLCRECHLRKTIRENKIYWKNQFI